MHTQQLVSQKPRNARSLRRVRLWLAIALVALGASGAGQARADVFIPQPQPRPIRVTPSIEGESSSVTTSGAPDHAFFHITNPRGARITVALESLVLLGAGGARLGITRVQVDGGAANPSSISVPVHGSVRLTVFFGGVPSARIGDQRYVVRLSARIAGSRQQVDTTISRATRHPWHR